MSVATYIANLEANRNTIRNKLIELGMAASSDKLDKLATAIEGIVNQGAVNITVQEGDTYTIPAGYHNGNGTVSGVAGGGNYNLQAKTATPTKKQQTIAPDSGFYGLSGVTVNAIPEAYQDTSSVTATAADVLTGKVFVTAAGVVTPGEMVNNGAVDKTLDVTTITYTIPKGYHSGSGKVKLVLETKTVTPTKSTQKITPTTGKVLSEVTVNPIPEEYITTEDATATAANILAGETAYVDGEKITGTMTNNGAVSKSLNTTSTSYTIPEGYHSGTGAVSITTEAKTATPTKSAQDIVPTSGKVLSKVSVAAIPDEYQDVSNVDAVATNVLAGKTIVDASGAEIIGTMPNNGAKTSTLNAGGSYTIPAGYHDGTGKITAKDLASQTAGTAAATEILSGETAWVGGSKVTGTMANNGATGGSIDGLNTTSVNIPAGYTTGGTVSLTSDIENALAAI